MNRAQVYALVVSLCVHGIIAWLTPEDGTTAAEKTQRTKRIVARTLPKPRPEPKPEPSPEPKPEPPAVPEPSTPKVEPAAVAPAPSEPKTQKRAPKRRSGRNLTSKRKRPGKGKISAGSAAGGPQNIGDWDPSGPAGPGPIDPGGEDEDGTRVERPSQVQPKPSDANTGSATTSKKRRRPKLRPAVPVYRPTPQWPAGLIKSGPITVPVRVRIDETGKITSAKALGSAPKLAKKAAVDFVKTIRWRAGRLGDINAKSTVVYTVKFRP